MLPAHIIDQLNNEQGESLPPGLTATVEGDALRLDLVERLKPGVNNWLLTAIIIGLACGTFALSVWCSALVEAEGGVTLASVAVGGIAFVLGILTFVGMMVPVLVLGLKESLFIEEQRVVWGHDGPRVEMKREGVLAVRVVSKREIKADQTDAKPCAALLELETEQGFLRLQATDWNTPQMVCIGRAIRFAWDIPLTFVSQRQADGDNKPRVSSGWDRKTWSVCVVALVGCIAFFAVMLAAYVPGGIASVDWPTVNGQATKVRYDTSGESTIAEMTYVYNVDGITYESDRIYFGYMHDSVAVKNLFKSHTVGSTVSVYYDPDDPSTSVLVPGVEMLMLVVLVVIAFFIFLLFTVLRRRPPAIATAMQALYVPVEIKTKQSAPAMLTRRASWISFVIVTLMCGLTTGLVTARVHQYKAELGWTRQLIITQIVAAIVACVPVFMLWAVLRNPPQRDVVVTETEPYSE